MLVTLFHQGTCYSVDIVNRQSNFLRVRLRGEVTGRELDLWIPAHVTLLAAYSRCFSGCTEDRLAALQDATNTIPESVHDYLLFVKQNL